MRLAIVCQGASGAGRRPCCSQSARNSRSILPAASRTVASNADAICSGLRIRTGLWVVAPKIPRRIAAAVPRKTSLLPQALAAIGLVLLVGMIESALWVEWSSAKEVQEVRSSRGYSYRSVKNCLRSARTLSFPSDRSNQPSIRLVTKLLDLAAS